MKKGIPAKQFWNLQIIPEWLLSNQRKWKLMPVMGGAHKWVIVEPPKGPEMGSMKYIWRKDVSMRKWKKRIVCQFVKLRCQDSKGMVRELVSIKFE